MRPASPFADGWESWTPEASWLRPTLAPTWHDASTVNE
jgi:hypothetical protein